jgi:hypothetical protein
MSASEGGAIVLVSVALFAFAVFSLLTGVQAAANTAKHTNTRSLFIAVPPYVFGKSARKLLYQNLLAVK